MPALQKFEKISELYVIRAGDEVGFPSRDLKVEIDTVSGKISLYKKGNVLLSSRYDDYISTAMRLLSLALDLKNSHGS